MELPWIYELLGYVASVLVAISLTMKSIRRLRVFNLVGSTAFSAYGLLIGAYPVAAVNLFIACINVYYLRQMAATREYFDLLRIRPDSEYLKSFLDFYRKDIEQFSPGFGYAAAEDQHGFFVLRDMVPAGLFLGAVETPGTLRVRLDYVTPEYRDLQTAQYLFRERADLFRELGVREIVSDAGTPAHSAYLRRVGFSPDPARPELYRMALA